MLRAASKNAMLVCVFFLFGVCVFGPKEDVNDECNLFVGVRNIAKVMGVCRISVYDISDMVNKEV